MRLAPPLVCGFVTALASCIFSPSYEGTSYLCPDEECPDGFECVAGRCEELDREDAAGDAAADAAADGSVDAVLDIDASACDPAAQPHNDTCGQAILLTPGQSTCGDTSDHTDVHNPGPACMSTTTIGPDAVYEIAAEVGQEISVVMTPAGWDGEVYLVDSCTSYTTCLAGSERIGQGVPEDFVYTAKSGDDGTDYFIIVDGATAVQFGEFTLSVNVE